jgi:hypothetical protein
MSAVPKEQLADLTTHHIEGIAREGNKPFSVPLYSQIDGNLWMGGTPATGGGAAPEHFKFIFCLYPWESYGLSEHQMHLRIRLFDHGEVPDPDLLAFLADTVSRAASIAPTLVHCQAGLNRSGLVTGLSLIRSGMDADKAIALLREKRCDAVLCNKAFESYLRECEPPRNRRSSDTERTMEIPK